MVQLETFVKEVEGDFLNLNLKTGVLSLAEKVNSKTQISWILSWVLHKNS